MAPTDPRFRWVLLLSVALNVLLAAVLASAWYQRGHHGSHRGAFWLPRAAMLERVLPESDHDAMRAAYARHRDQVRPRMQALWQARHAVHEAMHGEPFDAARVEAALATLRERDAEVAVAVHALLLDVSRSVSAEGRRAIGKLGERHHRHGAPGRRRDAAVPEHALEPEPR